MDHEEEKTLAKEKFNQCWNLIDKADRTSLEDEEMIRLARESRLHWGNVGTEKEWAIGEWQLSRVNVLVGDVEAALEHAELCEHLTNQLQTPNFMQASSAEAFARAFHLAGDLHKAQVYKERALTLLVGVPESDAKFIQADIDSLPF